jgi:hypothetical protein
MAEVIDQVNKMGYGVVSGRVVETGLYAFYSLHANKLTGEIEDVFFTAKRGKLGSYIYKPMTAAEYHNLDD